MLTFSFVFCLSFPGQERFGNMTRVYYKEAVGCFIVFDVTRVSTFEAVAKWKNDLDAKVQLPDGSKIPCVLLANKVFGYSWLDGAQSFTPVVLLHKRPDGTLYFSEEIDVDKYVDV